MSKIFVPYLILWTVVVLAIADDNETTMTSCICCGNASSTIEVVFYDEIKDLPNHPEVLLIDVREQEELKNTGKIPTSINIPLGILEKEISLDVDKEVFMKKYLRNKPYKDTQLIFSCRSGKRALQAADCAVSLGYENVKYYKGSWIDWAKHEGLPY